MSLANGGCGDIKRLVSEPLSAMVQQPLWKHLKYTYELCILDSDLSADVTAGFSEQMFMSRRSFTYTTLAIIKVQYSRECHRETACLVTPNRAELCLIEWRLLF
jgi:hypothetical protein